jgi:nitroreductase
VGTTNDEVRELTGLDIDQAIAQRRSIRRFLDVPVPEEAIAAMLESARLAPSGGNGQSWVFGVVTDKLIIERLAQAAGSQLWIATAPLVFALCARLVRPMAEWPEDDYGLAVNRDRFGADFVEYLRAFPGQRQVSMLLGNATPLVPGEHIALTAASLGLGSCWIGHLDVRRASAILGLPDDIVCLFLLPVGYAAAPPRPLSRKPLAEISFRDKWGTVEE